MAESKAETTEEPMSRSPYETHAERLRRIRIEKPTEVRSWTVVRSVAPSNSAAPEPTYQSVGNWRGTGGRKVGGPR